MVGLTPNLMHTEYCIIAEFHSKRYTSNTLAFGLCVQINEKHIVLGNIYHKHIFKNFLNVNMKMFPGVFTPVPLTPAVF